MSCQEERKEQLEMRITHSLEGLGMNEPHSFSMLPDDSEPTTGNWITGRDQNVTGMIERKIARTEAATVDLPAIAERYKLSEEARQLLADLIKRRTTTLERQLKSSHASDQRLRANAPSSR